MSTALLLLQETERAQGLASDPVVSAWVSANAGAGKTHVLKMRVLRLLLQGIEPQRILCLTYTKAAAAEMASRVFADLSKWATAPADELCVLLQKLLGRDADKLESERARRLFAAAIETPGGLKVQTIHAFCEQLLQRFPLEAGVPPGFQILDDEMVRTLLRESIDGMLRSATRDRSSELGQALQTAVTHASGDSFDEILAEAVRQPIWLEQMLRLDARGNGAELAEAEALYRSQFALALDDDAKTVGHEQALILSNDDLKRLRSVLAGGSTRDLEAAERVTAVLDAPSPELRAGAMASLFLNGDGNIRKGYLTKKLSTANPDLAEMMDRRASRFLALETKRRALAVVGATIALIRLGSDVLQRFNAAKAQRAALDFDDLIRQTARLLAGGEATAWVQFKLDGGLDHILVDEAQDTSPVQWSIIESLATEFFADTGARSAERTRTLFAVGDEKQSIYSFQGAAPKMFAATGVRFEAITIAAGQTWRRLPLQLSFRSVLPLLDAVDRIFSDPARGRGVTSEAAAVRHVALRQGHAGLIEMWPSELPDKDDAADPWSPLGVTMAKTPASRLAQRIAATIGTWLKTGEKLTSENRAIQPRDIIILVRNRRPFAPSMVAALKARGIAVAGADRMRLTDQIAVQDLMALGDFLTLPEDDLALATVLKSPFFDLDDDDLMRVAPERTGTLWSAVIDRAKTDTRFKPAAETLKRWRADADFTPPFEFFAKILDSDGARAKLLRRLGPDAADPIDEFLNRAIAYDDQAPPSMIGFLTWLRGGIHEIKRDMEQTRNEVRVMTVHGAKGLEAPIVFLPDTCSPGAKKQRSKLVAVSGHPLPSEIAAPLVWTIRGTTTLGAISEGQEVAKRAEEEEHRRLLYVALTRARDRLYVASFENKNKRPSDCWYDLIGEGLADVLEPATATDGGAVRRYESMQTGPHDAARHLVAEHAGPHALPDWAGRPAPREHNLFMPLAPSRLAPLETDDAGEPVELHDTPKASASAADIGSPSPLALATGDRFLRGTLTHALLEHLPSLPPETWHCAAANFLKARAGTLSARTQASIALETLAVLAEPAFAAVFGSDSRAEVPIIGEIENPNRTGPRLRISGQIDRLVETDHEVLIVDYKTNRPPPLEVAGIPAAYLYQMASYRLVLAQIFTNKPVRAAILWTDGPRLMPVPDEILDLHATQLWTLDAARLDG